MPGKSSFPELLPPSLRAAEADGGVKTVIKHSNDEDGGSDGDGEPIDHPSSDRFWVISYKELCGSEACDIQSNANTQYEYFALKGVRNSSGYTMLANMNQTIADGNITKSPSAASNVSTDSWWDRSCYDYANCYFMIVSNNGFLNDYVYEFQHRNQS